MLALYCFSLTIWKSISSNLLPFFCSGVGLAMKEICVSFGRYLCWSSHIFIFRGLVQSSRGYGNTNCCCCSDSSTCYWLTTPLPPIRSLTHVPFVLDQVCLSHDGKWHPLLLKFTHHCETEGGKRQTSFSVSCRFHCPHTLPYMSQFLHAYVHIQLSFTNVTLVDLEWIRLNTKYKYNSFYGLFHQL